MAAFSEKFLSENNFEAVLATFCCYEYGVNVSETVANIVTGQKGYHKWSLCVIVFCIAKAYHQRIAEVATKKEQ